MKVLSCRSVWPFMPNKLSIFCWESLSVIRTSSNKSRVQACISSLVIMGLAGCAQPRQDTELPRTGDPRVNKAIDECYADALKIIYTAPPRTASEYGAQQFFRACMKAKGHEL
jgi:hypothetical protein